MARTATLAARWPLLPLLLWTGAIALGGCMTSTASPARTPAASSNGRQDPGAIQSAVMGFADRYLSAIAEAYDRVGASSPSPESLLAAHQAKVQAAAGALGNAVNPNPVAGLMDMAVLVTLSRESAEEPWALQTFGAETLAPIVATLKQQEADIWKIAALNLSDTQVEELRGVTAQWRQEHPQERYVSGVRLADLPQATRSSAPDARIAASIFAIIRLDPFAGLDPAVRQVEQSRVLGERMFFYVRHMSTLLSWQAEALYLQMLAAPQARQLLADTSAFTKHTGEFAHSTQQFADASSQLSATVEQFRSQLPEQQAALVEQLNTMVAARLQAALRQAGEEIQTQREGALDQAAAELDLQRQAAITQAASAITAQRNAAVEQLSAAVTAQQELMAGKLQALLDRSVDRLFERLRTLVLIAAGAILAILIAWRLMGAGRAPAPRPGP